MPKVAFVQPDGVERESEAQIDCYATLAEERRGTCSA
jgi:hypothetical protein